MDEEAMWKGLYEKLQEQRFSPPTEHESKYGKCMITGIFSIIYCAFIRMTFNGYI